MADLFDNPMGLMGFEFVEFASPTPGVLEPGVARPAQADVLRQVHGLDAGVTGGVLVDDRAAGVR